MYGRYAEFWGQPTWFYEGLLVEEERRWNKATLESDRFLEDIVRGFELAYSMISRIGAVAYSISSQLQQRNNITIPPLLDRQGWPVAIFYSLKLWWSSDGKAQVDWWWCRTEIGFKSQCAACPYLSAPYLFFSNLAGTRRKAKCSWGITCLYSEAWSKRPRVPMSPNSEDWRRRNSTLPNFFGETHPRVISDAQVQLYSSIQSSAPSRAEV